MAAKTTKQQEANVAVSEQEENVAAVSEQEEEQVLLAQTYILYNSHQYKPGDELPASDAGMLEAWLEAGTAAWVTVSEECVGKAVPASAIAGVCGEAVSSDSDDGENLVGRVPNNAVRKRK